MTAIERLPYVSTPGYDCILDNANCPLCKSGRPNHHGRFGGSAFFAARTRLADGRHVVAALEVFLANYPSCSPRMPEHLRVAHGTYLTLHVEGGEKECQWMPSGRCGSVESDFSFLAGGELYAKHGNPGGGDDQSAAFWADLEEWLLNHAAGIELLS